MLYLYEVLARFGADGLQGCHKIMMDEYGRIGVAEEISAAEAAELIATAPVINNALPADEG